MPHFLKIKRKNICDTSTRTFSAGFTLLELIVTITIFVVLTSAILFRNSRFKNDLLITNLAYEMALSIREAQTYGINVKEFNATFNSAYGVHFDVAKNKQFELFVDANSNNIFSDPPDTIVSTYSLRGDNVISNLCVDAGSGTCSSSSNSLDITFKRPDPEAKIYANGNSYKRAQIKINSSDNTERIIEVNSTGQISVLPF